MLESCGSKIELVTLKGIATLSIFTLTLIQKHVNCHLSRNMCQKWPEIVERKEEQTKQRQRGIIRPKIFFYRGRHLKSRHMLVELPSFVLINSFI